MKVERRKDQHQETRLDPVTRDNHQVGRLGTPNGITRTTYDYKSYQSVTGNI